MIKQFFIGMCLFFCISALYADEVNAEDQLYPGNELSLSFMGSSTLTKIYRINAEGFIELPEVGKVDCKNQNLTSLREILLKKLSYIYKDPKFLVLTKKSNDIYIKVSGLVTNPGLYLLSPEDSFQDAIQKAGGMINGAQLDQLQLRHNNVSTVIDYKKYLDTGDKNILPPLVAMDEIFVPSSKLLGNVKMPYDALKNQNGDAANLNLNDAIKIFGEVRNPGAYAYNSKLSALDYLLKAGGTTRDAETAQIKIIDNDKASIFNLKQFLNTAQKGFIPAISAGATIFVPKDVGVLKTNTNSVYVMGQVQKAGPYELGKTSSFMDVLANAGGPNQYAESRKIRLIKPNGDVTLFDMQAYLEGGKEISMPLPSIGVGDVIYIPLKTNLNEKSWLDIEPSRAIKIMGAVKQPGRYEWADDMNLLDLLSNVGGPEKTADTAHIRIISNDKSLPIEFDLKSMIEKGLGPDMLPKLKAGFTVFVPELSQAPVNTQTSIKVFGEVYKPGSYAYNAKQSAIDYLLEAGGITHYASPEHIKIIDSNSGTTFNLKEFLDTANSKNMPVIKPGSTIFVPISTREVKTGIKTVYVMGQVQKPGPYELGLKSSFMDVLANSGGPNQYAESRKIRLIKPNGDVTLFDMQAYLEDAQKTKLDIPAIGAGDVIYIPLKTNLNEKSWLDIEPSRAIKIMGAVKQPGRYEWADDMNLLDLLSNVGGPEKTADTAHIRIISNDKSAPIEFDLKSMIEKGLGPDTLPKLKAGFTVFVPELSQVPVNPQTSIKVFGEVYKPGSYAYNAKQSAIDYLLEAGGITHYASPEHIKIIDSNSGTTFNLKEFLDTANSKNMPVIKPGSTIFVPISTPEVKTGAKTVYVMGQVQKPGPYELGLKSSFMDVLANAGGPNQYAESRKIRLIKPNGDVTLFDMQAYLEGDKKTKLDIPVMGAGDVIYIPLKTNLNEKSWLDIEPSRAIKIMGAVKQPGRYEWADDMNLLDLLSNVGGPEKTADTAHIRIISDDKSAPIEFDLKSVIEKGLGPEALPKLKAGFTVFVPELSQVPVNPQTSIKVFGEVYKPGSYAYNAKQSAIDYLLEAGGITHYASPEHIKIIDSNSGTTFNLKEFLDTANSKNMPVIKPGSTIFVPISTPEVKIGAKTVYVMGQVQKPGPYELGLKSSFMDVLASAGGPNQYAESRKIRLIKPNGDVTLFDMQAYLEGDKKTKLDIPVMGAGDVIYIPLKTNLNEKSWLDIEPSRAIKIMGAVKQPGRYEWADDMNLLDLLSNVGGPEKTADTAHIRIISDDKSAPIEFDLKSVIEKGLGPEALPKLKAGFTVFVPELSQVPVNTQTSIKVFGEVYKPGSYAYNAKQSAIEYLLEAGGITHYASPEHIKILDNDSAVDFNLKEYLNTGKASKMPTIKPGTTLFVPVKIREVKAGSRTVYVMGQVNKPGPYELGEKASFMDALANAGGSNQYGENRKIRIISEDGHIENFDMQAYTEGLTKIKMPKIKSGDVIYIPIKTDLNEKSWLEVAPNHAIKIIGAVQRPGRYEWSNEMSFLDILAHAGGPTNRADTAHVRIITDEKTTDGAQSFRFNLSRFIEQGSHPDQLPVIKAGYTIDMPTLPRSPIDNKGLWTLQDPKSTIYVFGEVQKPGRYNFNEQLNFLDILSAADGPSAKANLQDIHVIDRQGIYPQVVHVNLSLYFETGDPELIPKVLPGDAIYLPAKTQDYNEVNSRHVIKILGEVKKPGRYRFTSDMTILDLLSAAGGPSAQALVSKILVVNIGPRMQSKSSTFDLLQFAKTGNLLMLPTLREGDVIYIPNNNEDARTQFANVLQNLANAALIISSVGSLKI